MIKKFFLFTVMGLLFVKSALRGSDTLQIQWTNHSSTAVTLHISLNSPLVFSDSPLIRNLPIKSLTFTIAPHDSRCFKLDIAKLKIDKINILQSNDIETVVPYQTQSDFPCILVVNENGKIEITTQGQKNELN